VVARQADQLELRKLLTQGVAYGAGAVPTPVINQDQLECSPSLPAVGHDLPNRRFDPGFLIVSWDYDREIRGPRHKPGKA
jgi:hypothetical protein